MPASESASATRPMTASTAWLPIAIGLLVVLMVTFHQVTQPDLAAAYRDPVLRLAALACILTAIALVALQRYRVGSKQTREGLLLGFVIVVAFWISLVETGVPMAHDRPVVGFSAVGPWIIVACTLVTARTSWTFAAALAAASMWPLAYGINVVRLDLALAPWSRLVVWPGLNYGMAVLVCLLRRHLATRSAVAAPAEGDLGSYHLLAPIGAGGMGEVWRATHQLLARQAAIKLVRPQTAASSRRQLEQWVQRFHREANTIAALQSPHTIYLYDFGVAGDGQFYYVMELLDGISLQALVTTFGPQPPGRVRSILRQICESLEEAHERNLVHRDLKPSNVMLCKLALTHDFVKVLDFGLAKCAACEDVAQITMEGVAAGTPGYIAPEVALGEQVVDGRADIYALGCVAYFLLTGTLVFEETNAMSMVVRHVQTEPAPPSERTELPIPADLERVVLSCLGKKPADRPASARAVASLLDQCDLAPWTEAQAATWWAEHLPETSSLRVQSELSTGAGSTRTVQRVAAAVQAPSR